MKHELSTDDIANIIAHAHQLRNAAASDMMAAGYRKLVTWIAKRIDQLAHAFTSLPTKAH